MVTPDSAGGGKELRMRRESTAVKLDRKLREINLRLKGFGVPFDLTRLGNYRKGEFQIEDAISVFMHRDFKITVVFRLREPYTGNYIDHWAQFNSTYSTEARSAHIIVPVVNGDMFLLIRAYGAFIGREPLVFPRGFIPKSAQDLAAVEVSKSIMDRKVMELIREAGGEFVGEPRLLQTSRGDLLLAEDQSTSGNLVTVSTISIKLDEVLFQELGRKARKVQIVQKDEFLQLVQRGEIMDLHSLSAFVGYEADKLG